MFLQISIFHGEKKSFLFLFNFISLATNTFPPKMAWSFIQGVFVSLKVDPNNSFVVVSTTDKAIFTEAVISTDKWHHVVVVIKV